MIIKKQASLSSLLILVNGGLTMAVSKTFFSNKSIVRCSSIKIALVIH
jgi:hypothetical protein